MNEKILFLEITISAPHPMISKDLCNLHSFVLIVRILRFKDLSNQLDIGLYTLRYIKSVSIPVIIVPYFKKVFRISNSKNMS